MSTWTKYRSHRVIEAAPILAELRDPHGVVDAFLIGDVEGPEVFQPTVPGMAEKGGVGDYAIRYEDGFLSVSPKDVFDAGYTEVQS